ncbi:MAG: helix-turn-helix transcriptional regulator, partial [Clostridia bacterium]|nr:helix-turn-helix transcriptional regulator [Clostridia bacterium]
MNYACNLLATTDATTLSIATSLAYDSLSSFNHLFKAHTGVSPTEYRKSHKQSKTQRELS